MFKKIDSYILEEMTSAFLFGVIAFSSIFAGVGIIPNLVRETSSYGLGLSVVFQLFLARVPQVMVYTFPMSILLATLTVFGRLSSDSEITAFRASGVSLSRIIRPALILGLIVSLLTLTFNEMLVPKANIYVNYLIAKARNEFQPVFRTSINIPQFEDGVLKRTINAKEMYKQTMKQVTVIEYDEGNLKRVIFADSAGFLAGKGWLFSSGILYMFDQAEDAITRVSFEKENINLKINPTDINVILDETGSQDLGYKDLSDRIAIKSRTGQDVSKMKVELYLKTAVPFACFIFTLLGAPLGLKPQRQSSTVGIGFSLLVVVFYYILMAIGQWMGLIHVFSPLIAAWIPNIIIGGIGAWLLWNKANE